MVTSSASSKSCYWLTVYDKVSEFYAVHGSLRCCTRRKRKIRTLLQSETGSDFSCLVGAGGCREPRKIKRNPGRGSQRLRRALGGTRILLAAAPTAPPCFCRWQRSSLLHRAIRRALRVALAAFSAAPWQGFEKAERCPSLASLFPPQAAVGSAAVRIRPRE